MAVLHLDRRGLALKREGRSLALFLDGERHGNVPMHLIERIVMRSNVSLDSSLLAHLADAGIGVLILGGRRGRKQAVVLGRAHNDGARRIGQYRAYGDRLWRRQWAQRLVVHKLKGQMRLLRRALGDRPDLRNPLTTALARLEHARREIGGATPPAMDRLRGIEGAAAAAYFQGFTRLFPPSLEFAGRNRRPPKDPVNAVLSLSYTLLHFEAVQAVYAAGLDPLIGFYHELAFGRESLASDLIEPLRPKVDAWAWEQFRERRLRLEDFIHDGDACLLGKGGRKGFFGGFELFVRPQRRWLRRIAGKLAATLSEAGTKTEQSE